MVTKFKIMEKNMEKEFYSVKELQEIFGCGRSKIYKIIGLDGFPTIRIGKNIYIPIKVFNEWKNNQLKGEQI